MERLEDLGFNAHRVPMMWAAARPAENMTDHAYLTTMARVVENLAQHHQYALLDMHQDVLSSRLADSAGDSGYDGAPRWLIDRTHISRAYPWPLTPPLKSWGDGYLTEATGQCFEDVYENTHGGRDEWATFWQEVAAIFRQQRGVLGYELINEPWVGNPYKDPLLFAPGAAGAHLSGPCASGPTPFVALHMTSSYLTSLHCPSHDLTSLHCPPHDLT